jgi:hypothetical protein
MSYECVCEVGHHPRSRVMPWHRLSNDLAWPGSGESCILTLALLYTAA